MPEKGSGRLFRATHEIQLIVLSIVLIGMSLMTLRIDTLLNVASIHSILSLEIWLFKLVFSGVGFTVGVIALLVGIADSRIVTSS